MKGYIQAAPEVKGNLMDKSIEEETIQVSSLAANSKQQGSNPKETRIDTTIKDVRGKY